MGKELSEGKVAKLESTIALQKVPPATRAPSPAPSPSVGPAAWVTRGCSLWVTRGCSLHHTRLQDYAKELRRNLTESREWVDMLDEERTLQSTPVVPGSTPIDLTRLLGSGRAGHPCPAGGTLAPAHGGSLGGPLASRARGCDRVGPAVECRPGILIPLRTRTTTLLEYTQPTALYMRHEAPPQKLGRRSPDLPRAALISRELP